MVLRALNGAEFETDSPAQPDKLEKTYVEFTEGDFLGDVTIKAVHVKDFKEFRDMSIHDFGNDDWRAFKFMVKLYKSYKHLMGLQQYIKPEGKKDGDNKATVRK